MPLTPEQEAAITARKPQVIVTASAGAGKTSTMVNRVIDLIVKDKLSASSIIMLTFTDAAAAEMKSKLERALLDRIRKANREERDLLVKVLDRLPLLHCSTIDSYCYSFVKSHFEHLHLPPTISMIDPETAKAYREKAITQVLENNAKESLDGENADPDEYYRFLSSFGSEEEKALAEAVNKVYDYAETTENGDDFLVRAANYAASAPEEMPSVRDMISKVKRDAREAKRKIDAFCFVPPATAERMSAGMALVTSVLENVEKATSLRESLLALKAAGKPAGVNKAERERYAGEYLIWGMIADLYLAWRAALPDIDAHLKQDPDDCIAEILSAQKDALKIIELTVRFKKEYQAIKRAEEVLDYADAEHYALELLKNPSVVEEVGCRQLLMDESQDLNRLQEALMTSLAGKGHLYVVGDVKQSIYRFRLAEPNLFNERVKRCGKDDSAQVIAFNKNFRSGKAVIDYVNQVFSHLMTEDFGGFDYVPATREETPCGEGKVECLFYQKESDKVTEEIKGVYSVERGAAEAEASEQKSSGLQEAWWVRDHILELMRNKTKVYDAEKRTTSGFPYTQEYLEGVGYGQSHLQQNLMIGAN